MKKSVLKLIYAKLCEQCPKNFRHAFCRKAPFSRIAIKAELIFRTLLTELEKDGFVSKIPLFHGRLYYYVVNLPVFPLLRRKVCAELEAFFEVFSSFASTMRPINFKNLTDSKYFLSFVHVFFLIL